MKLEALSHNLNTQIHLELLYNDDMVIVTKTLEKCVENPKKRKTGLQGN